jgi:hypothetical protein
MMTKETPGEGGEKEKKKKKKRGKKQGKWWSKLSRNPISFWRGFEMKLTRVMV